MSNVKGFGAAGDGKTDDTEAIRHAIADADGRLQFPRGNYLISETIEIKLDEIGRIGIDGDDGTATIIMAGEGPAFRIIGTHEGTGDPNSVKPNVWERQRMPTMRNIEITATNPEADGVELIATMQAILEGVLIRQVRHGIRLHQRNRNVQIQDSHIYHNTGVGVFFDGVNLHQTNICGNHISYNRLGGIRIERSQIYNLQITGNDIEYNNHRAFDAEPEPTAEIYIDTTTEPSAVDEVTIASNTIQATPSPGGANIRVLNKKGEGPAPGLWTITGNIIGNQENNVHLTGCYGIVLSGNCIYSC
ncbi:MAG: glycosyl hydrolase family 28-related protein, partial [Pirellulaceae bacterium]|nr:glycosyl hydrolase family 28-related protein [Pirellulaceae bacterium]